MARLVLKFGGTSVRDLDHVRRAATRVAREVEAGHQVAVIVSAMAGETNRLVELCSAVSPLYDAREYDSIVASGEQVTSGLMALTLQDLGVPARSWLGWQIPVTTDDMHGKARILGIDGTELLERMASGEVPVVAGFQGVSHGGPSRQGRIATLGRGGSDTSAVALAAALAALRCDIYTDVDGVYTADPRIVRHARKIPKVTYEEMLEMASLGAKVLQTRAAEMAMKHRVPLRILSSFEDKPGTDVVDEDEIVEQEIVSGITYSRDDAKITLIDVPDRPGLAAAVFGPLADAGINVDMILQNISEDGGTTDITFTVSRSELARSQSMLTKAQSELGFRRLVPDENVVKISVIGMGMRSHAGVAKLMFRTLADNNINIKVISTSEIKISVLVAEQYTELAVRALHSAYGLDHIG